MQIYMKSRLTDLECFAFQLYIYKTSRGWTVENPTVSEVFVWGGFKISKLACQSSVSYFVCRVARFTWRVIVSSELAYVILVVFALALLVIF